MAKQIPRSLFDDYDSEIRHIQRLSEQEIRGMTTRQLREYVEGMSNDAWNRLKTDVVDTVATTTQDYANAAASAAAQFTEDVVSWTGKRVKAAMAVNSAEANRERLTKSVRYHARKILDGHPLEFVDAMVAKTRTDVSAYANRTVIQSAVANKVAYARVPTGRETCGFCLMLASRGFVYANSRTAGEFDHFHDNCDCRIVPSYALDSTLEGYDPSVYLAQYAQARADAWHDSSTRGDPHSISMLIEANEFPEDSAVRRHRKYER